MVKNVQNDFHLFTVRNLSICTPAQILRGQRQTPTSNFSCPKDCEELKFSVNGMFVGNMNLKAYESRGVYEHTARYL